MTTGYVCVSSWGLPTAPNKSANLNTQNVGPKIVSPPMCRAKSKTQNRSLRTHRPIWQEDPPTSWLLHLRSKLATKLNTQSTATKIDKLSPNAHAHTSAVPCRRVCHRLTTANLAIRADDCSLLLHCFGFQRFHFSVIYFPQTGLKPPASSRSALA